jgi:hypothetical protein
MTRRIVLVATGGVDRGRVKLGVPEQRLDHADVDLLVSSSASVA